MEKICSIMRSNLQVLLHYEYQTWLSLISVDISLPCLEWALEQGND